ncbi:rhomboid-like protein [Actinocatenispora sera]|uniref:rhomboid-like protein n=1 Tax=Actinocatenispora sera TaxID=390989 RepID=UPI0033C55B5E
MITVAVLLAVTILWYLLRAVARIFTPAARLVRRLGRWTGRLHAWVLSAPATFAYCAIFTASTLVQRAAPPRLITVLTTIQSTNLVGLHAKPISVLVASGLWVADRGAGLIGYLAVFTVVAAYAERRYGTPRLVLIGLAGHVLGSLLTAVVELHAIRTGAAPRSLALSTDVGVSYVMVACCAAAILVLPGWLRIAGAVVLALGVLAPVLVHGTIWDLGHLLATLCGLGAALLLLAIRPTRVPLPVDDLAARLAVRRPPHPGAPRP